VTEEEARLRLQNEQLRGALISAAGCILDLFEAVSAIKTALPIAGGGKEAIEAPLVSLSGRITKMLERIELATGEAEDGK